MVLDQIVNERDNHAKIMSVFKIGRLQYENYVNSTKRLMKYHQRTNQFIKNNNKK
jgi:hypothetical protein